MLDESYFDQIRGRLAEIEAQLSSPETGSQPKLLAKLMGEHAELKKLEAVAEEYFGLLHDQRDSRELFEDADSDAELKEMASEELARIEKALPGSERRMMIALLPPRPEDSRNTMVEIRAGTGGDEAALFAADLFRMYVRYIENKGWKYSVIDVNMSDIGGYKEMIFSVEGQSVYRTLRYESGTHRVQRIPATESGGRIHTSAATVAVLPEVENIADVDIKTEDLRIDVYRSSGAGGQHVNTTDSAVRITHLPTGIVVQSQEERSQHRNKDKAMKALATKIYDVQLERETSKMASDRKTQIGSGDRSERIRTYNYPQNRITDHRINLTLYHLDRIMEGALSEVVDVLYERDIEDRLENEVLNK